MKLVLLITALIAGTAFAADRREDFAYGARLELEESGQSSALRRATLTAEVYRRAAFADLRDLRVFNSANETVPHALRTPPVERRRRQLAPAPLFPLHGDAVKALEALRVVITSEHGSVRVQTPSAAQTAPSSGYLLDLREVRDPIVALELAWSDSSEFASMVDVAVSDDLSGWRGIASGASLVNLRFAGQLLNQHRIEFSPVRAKFVRLTPRANTAPFQLTSASVEPIAAQIEPSRITLQSLGEALGTQGYAFDLQAQAPVDRVHIRLPEPNTLIRGTLWSRARVDGEWRMIAQAMFYRIEHGGAEIQSAPLPVPQTSDRYWRLAVDGSGLGSGLPRLQAEWIPAQLEFLARGSPPFTLAVGNNLALNAESALAAVVERESASAERLKPANARIGDFVDLGGASKLTQSPPILWRNWLLWGVLVVGVGLLGWMSARLLREMKST